MAVPYIQFQSQYIIQIFVHPAEPIPGSLLDAYVKAAILCDGKVWPKVNLFASFCVVLRKFSEKTFL